MILNYTRLYDDIYGWLINNKTKVDELGNEILLVNEIKVLFPGKFFKYHIHNEFYSIEFENDLSQEEQDQLQNLITEYQTIGVI